METVLRQILQSLSLLQNDSEGLRATFYYLIGFFYNL